MEADFNIVNDMLIMANQAEGADRTDHPDGLQKLVSDYPAFTFFESEVFRKAQVDMINQAMILFYGILAALVIPGLIAMVNTLAINVIERTREIGVLRAVGATRKQVSRMVLAESLLLSAFGILLGIVTGLLMGAVLVAAISDNGFQAVLLLPVERHPGHHRDRPGLRCAGGHHPRPPGLAHGDHPGAALRVTRALRQTERPAARTGWPFNYAIQFCALIKSLS